MTNPAASNSGFSALVAMASALADAGAAITGDQVRQVSPQLAAFFGRRRSRPGRRAGWPTRSAAHRRLRADQLRVGAAVDEGDRRRHHDRPPERRRGDGRLPADAAGRRARPTSRDRYQRVVEYLRREDVQRTLVDRTYRRPVVAAAAPADRFPGPLVELPFPVRLDTADALIAAYGNTLRRAPRTHLRPRPVRLDVRRPHRQAQGGDARADRAGHQPVRPVLPVRQPGAGAAGAVQQPAEGRPAVRGAGGQSRRPELDRIRGRRRRR